MASAFECGSKKAALFISIETNQHPDLPIEHENGPNDNCLDENIPTFRPFTFIAIKSHGTSRVDTLDCLFERNQFKRPPKTA